MKTLQSSKICKCLLWVRILKGDVLRLNFGGVDWNYIQVDTD